MNLEELLCILALVGALTLRDILEHRREIAKYRMETDRNRILPRVIPQRDAQRLSASDRGE